MTRDKTIRAFERACRQKIDETCAEFAALVTELEGERDALTVEVAELREARRAGEAELVRRADRIASLESLVRTLQRPVNAEPSDREKHLEAEVSRLERERGRLRAERAERDEKIRELSAPADEQIAALREELEEERRESQSYQEEATELAKRVDELEDQIPGAVDLASEVHDYLRSAGIVSEILDVPLRLTPHHYLAGLVATVAAELPS